MSVREPDPANVPPRALSPASEPDQDQAPLQLLDTSPAGPAEILARIHHGDLSHPVHWQAGKKFSIMAICSVMAAYFSFHPFLAQDQTASGGLSLYSLGTALGPLLMAPFS